jgi:hypothetical protein
MPKPTKAQLYFWKPVLVEYNDCCGGCGSPLDLQYDHVIPRCAGGSDHPTNIQILCYHCNQHKGMLANFPRTSPKAPEYDTRQILENRKEFVYALRTWKNTIDTTA